MSLFVQGALRTHSRPPLQAALAAVPPSTPDDPDEAILRACLAEEAPGRVTGYGPAAAAAALSCAPHLAGTGIRAPAKQVLVGRGPAEGDEDIIGRLVAVFGSVDVFIQEYRCGWLTGGHVT